MVKVPKVSIDDAKPDKLFYFVCTVIPYRADDCCVLGYRCPLARTGVA